MTTQPLLDFDAPPARAASEARRELGVSRAATAARRNAPGWEDAAVAAVRAFALTHDAFVAEDVRETFATPAEVDGRAFGHVMRRAAREGIVRKDGYAPANSSNRSPKVRWRSLVFAGKMSA